MDKIPKESAEEFQESRKPGANSQRNSLRKTPDKFSEEIPEGISGENRPKNFWTKSPQKFLDVIY